MAEEIAGYVSTVTGLCLEFSDFAPGWILLQTFLFFIATGLAVFDTYSDWIVVLNYQEFGYNNPLLPTDQNLLRAWYLFATVATILTVVSFTNDLVDLGYSMFMSCKKHWCKCCMRLRKPEVYINSIELKEEGETGEEKSEDEEISDPCRCCYHCGCNTNTRNETLSTLALWFQDVPLLALAITSGLTQYTCQTPDPSNGEISQLLRDIGISLVASIVAGNYRIARSAFRVWGTIGVRVKDYFCRKLLPKKGNAAFPPNTPAQFLIFPFVCSNLFQIVVIILMAALASLIFLFSFGSGTASVAIYRNNYIDRTQIRLFNISGNIIRDNGSFVNLEMIDPGFGLDEIYCLSEFQYRPSESQIFFNAVELVVISPEGLFCANRSGNGNETENFCRFYYTDPTTLFYASGRPGLTTNTRVDRGCIFYSLSFDRRRAEPVVDFSIRVDENIDSNAFPRNGEEILLYYPPPINSILRVNFLLNQPRQLFATTFTFSNSTSGENTTCSLDYCYDLYGNVEYSYRDVYNVTEDNCSCSPLFSPAPECMRIHENFQYAYFDSQNEEFISLTSCSTIPQERVKPLYTPTLLVSCPCF